MSIYLKISIYSETKIESPFPFLSTTYHHLKNFYTIILKKTKKTGVCGRMQKSFAFAVASFQWETLFDRCIDSILLKYLFIFIAILLFFLPFFHSDEFKQICSCVRNHSHYMRDWCCVCRSVCRGETTNSICHDYWCLFPRIKYVNSFTSEHLEYYTLFKVWKSHLPWILLWAAELIVASDSQQ